MLFAATAISFLAGLLYIWSVISQGLTTTYGWNGIQTSLPYTVSLVAMVISMAIFGRLYDAKGPRICVMLSGTLTGLGLVLSGFVHSPEMMIVTFGIITGAGLGFASVTATPMALKWYAPQKKEWSPGSFLLGSRLHLYFIHL